FAAQLGALALRRRGVRAAALASSEAFFDGTLYRGGTVIALSQSGRSSDVHRALDLLEPALLVALTNDATSPLVARAHLTLDAGAGSERAVPATKSVTAMAAILLWAAGLSGGSSARGPATLRATAGAVEAWLASEGIVAVAEAAQRLARRRSVAIVGAGYGVPIASEIALKIKEASYLHAEGFAAGEFRHGSAAILDAATALVGIVDESSREVVQRPLAEAERSESLRLTIGAKVAGIPLLGPIVDEAFNTLAWLVAGQYLALSIGRARGVDSDAPRGLTKFVT
ncbi:MAG TPA: SIS domain-containing protein, partial [Candidatus Baltobacteraceae bacterium]|nr:SIS domain-containing protein [Candidatus Baltobacteraceae bacterium]